MECIYYLPPPSAWFQPITGQHLVVLSACEAQKAAGEMIINPLYNEIFVGWWENITRLTCYRYQLSISTHFQVLMYKNTALSGYLEVFS